MATLVRTFAFAIIAAFAVGSARATEVPPPFALKSISVELPTSDRTFPYGPGVAVMDANCLICHSAGMVLNQPALSKTAWDGIVHKMVKVYKAPIEEADIATIVDYLTATKGAK
ncbi:c-type cytochrome [Methylocella silvestris]|uniref:Sulfite:cytochrome C oxidoreductase subunit b n=1 Tax=Methylocella silvestris TaxID=199596 RepID=A0A2J7TDT0_METSI|nr:cytochrome c [Methylocella silvestris]PNG24935.1 sulfite:cytochrome C oxidoreductase subunit b precursor [Methylocella silvestris]